MSEPPGSGPLQNPEASLEDIRRALQALTEADWVKLNAYAELRVRIVGISAPSRDACHLFMQAMDSLETGRRHWYPGNVDLVKFLIDAMWSISSNWARRREKTGYVEVPETDLVRYSEEREERETVLEQAQSQDANPEEQLLQSEIPTQEQLEQEIKDLFKDKPLVFQILDGWSAEMKGPEIIEVLNIDENQYQTAARLVRRRTKARWPKGMPHVR